MEEEEETATTIAREKRVADKNCRHGRRGEGDREKRRHDSRARGEPPPCANHQQQACLPC